MTDHPVIWLQPWCKDCQVHDTSDTGRTWCQDAVYEQCECGAMPVKYVIAPDQPQPEPQEQDEDE